MRADRVLVVGQSVRHIACSAARAGLVVFAADCYGDLDLVESVFQSLLLDCDLSAPGALALSAERMIREVLHRYTVDYLVLGPGVEEMRVEGVRVLNNPPDKISLVSDKLELARWLEAEGFASVPAWPLGEEMEGVEFPLMVKPRRGAGGVDNRLVSGGDDLAELKGELIVQEMVVGIPSSVSVIADGERAVAISANEQLIGTPWLGGSGFRYCGNISPLVARDDSALSEMMKTAEEIAVGLNLVGSNGIDFILTESGPLVLEVNPRFQGSLDSVEISSGMNLFRAHQLSFDGRLPRRPKPRGFGGRAILFAKDDLKIDVDLRIATKKVADVPRPGSFAKKGEPVASIKSFGKERVGALELLRRRSSLIYEALRWPAEAHQDMTR
ncbi:ATP-grasp domain-containing protein [Methanocrinis sp.]|uniref:ATP-grasp domain-containing protein n=1 Tax=Methanocrinis sp. TaxID=3101522 RepID=UPI003D10FBDC